MTRNPHHHTAFWLVVSVCLLSSLIPGGPIENRDFSHIDPLILGGFNIFLTVLDLGSLLLVYFAIKQRDWALKFAFAAAIAFFGVYAIDLAQIFPRSPTPMSFSLALIEVLGMTAAVPLMFAARRAQKHTNNGSFSSANAVVRYAVVAAMLVAGLVIVWFATDAAMGGGTSSVMEVSHSLRVPVY